MPTDHTETQPSPNISTEHQAEGDARRPSGKLDRGQGDGGATMTQPSPNLGTEADEHEDRPEAPNHTSGSNRQESVEDRPNVGIVTPEDYPQQQ